MLMLRPGNERGYTDHGWLRSFHSFSFAGYRDPAHMGFGALRVINEDRVAAGQGFATHSHADMEIISVVLGGELAHRDSMGNSSVIRPGEVQRMSAGTGITHSEYNPSAENTTHFLQIWVLPERNGVTPSYEQKAFDLAERRGRLRLIVSGDGADGSLHMNQDARLYVGLFDGDEHTTLPLAPGRLGYVHVVRGAIDANGQALEGGDALKLDGEPAVHLRAGRDAEVLVFDLPR